MTLPPASVNRLTHQQVDPRQLGLVTGAVVGVAGDTLAPSDTDVLAVEFRINLLAPAT